MPRERSGFSPFPYSFPLTFHWLLTLKQWLQQKSRENLAKAIEAQNPPLSPLRIARRRVTPLRRIKPREEDKKRDEKKKEEARTEAGWWLHSNAALCLRRSTKDGSAGEGNWKMTRRARWRCIGRERVHR